ncbi:MAG: hypothetical protein WD073_04605, partial [Xanthobacteraceae bacterium]
MPGEFFLRIVNREQGTYLQTLNGPLELGPVPSDGDGANWIIEPVEGQLFVRIRNVATGLYLLMQTPAGPLDVGALVEPPADGSLPQTPQPAPPTAEWEFLALIEQPGDTPVIVVQPVPFEVIIPAAPEWIPHIRSCTGGKIFVGGICRCPIETAERNGICVSPRFDCEGGRIIRLQCVCPDGRLPAIAGLHRFTCQRDRPQEINCRAGQRPAVDGCNCRAPRQVINGVCRLPDCRIGQSPAADRCLCQRPNIMDAGGVCRAAIRVCRQGERPINDGCLCRAPMRMDNAGVCREPGQQPSCRIGQRPAADQCECRAPNILQNDGVCRARLPACNAGQRPINDGCFCERPMQMDNAGVCRAAGQPPQPN